MNHKEAAELLPIIQAFAERKPIQYFCKNSTPQWIDVSSDGSLDFSDHFSRYRIKPEPKYRPFASAKECFEEMKKHQPFGWIKDKHHQYFNIITICTNFAATFQYDEVDYYDYRRLINEYTFVDGSTFGIKED